jgi:cyclic pyranopterin phosphate synthase
MDKRDLHDAFGRRIEYMRVSLTDRCNFRCLYCMPPEGLSLVSHREILGYEELLRLCAITASLGIARYKITGGEPLCRKDAPGFIRRLTALPGVEEVTLTTNGSLLSRCLDELAEAGLAAVTVSCDALSPEGMSRMTRSREGDFGLLAAAMARAKVLNLRVKINTVPLRGYNEAELVPLARFALERGYHIRFIELMPVGLGKDLAGIPLEEVAALMEREFGPLERIAARLGNGPAVCYAVPGQTGVIGFIAALSHRFCRTCNRVRLTSSGFLKTCLHHNVGLDLRETLRSGGSDAELAALIRKAVRDKPQGHSFSFAPVPGEKTFFMHSVGG